MACAFAALALGLNIVVGMAGLLDLGYAAFFAIGAYVYGVAASWQLSPPWDPFWEPFQWLGLVARIAEPGGDLDLEWPDDASPVFMTGPAAEVFSGEWPD